MSINYRSLLKLLSILLLTFSIGCSNSDDVVPEEINKEELASKIQVLSDSLSLPMDAARAKQLSMDIMRTTTQFVEVFSSDPRCPDYLFISARAANGLRKYDKSLKILDTIKKKYNGYSKMPEVYFLYAFTLDEDLERKEDAKLAYMELINKFPDNHLSQQSVLLMEQLYMSDEELIEMWNQQEEQQ